MRLSRPGHLVIALLWIFACSGEFSQATEQDPPPNVLFIAVDDLRPELGTYGTNIKTPNIDMLAKTGMRFDRAYCQQAVCGASRLSIMGGLYPTKTKEQTFHVSGWRNRHPDLLTINQHFGQNGYRTIGLGKILSRHRRPRCGQEELGAMDRSARTALCFARKQESDESTSTEPRHRQPNRSCQRPDNGIGRRSR